MDDGKEHFAIYRFPFFPNMSSYRFCRTDDIGLLVDALNRCGNDPPMTPAAFKRSIRDLQVWCSSCMVAFSGPDPIGVLIGAKRPAGTLICKIAVHPDHLRQGHGRHLLTSLSSKLAILGPPRIVAEVPESFTAASALFSACGYVEEAVITDYVAEPLAETTVVPGVPGTFVIPVTVDDLAANGLLAEDHPQTCWARSIQTLTARKEEISGIAVASDERIEAYILYIRSSNPADGSDIVAFRSLIADGGARLAQLLSVLRAGGLNVLRFAKVHPEEISRECLDYLGFQPASGYRRYAALARSA
jgi:ribosomal protein S18 acetylase RimI-like enzyme